MSHCSSCIYCRKTYTARLFFGILQLFIKSEDRENGEYKNIVYLKLFGRCILSLEYRTGKTTRGVNTSVGYFRQGKKYIEYDSEPSDHRFGIGGIMKTIWKNGNIEAEVAEERKELSHLK